MVLGKAKLLMQVGDLQASLAFYMTQLGSELLETAPSGRAALIRISIDYEVVLMEGEEIKDLHKSFIEQWLLPKFHRPKRGELVYVGVTSVADVQNRLLINGVSGLQIEEDSGSICKLVVPTQDSYTFVFWEELYPSDEEILKMYTAGPDKLEHALHGLSEEQLSLSEEPGKWSIRQQVLHLIDLEMVTIHKVKFALAESGRFYQGNSFSQDDWNVGLDYVQRPIVYEVQMFRTMRQHILGLCKHLSGAMQRTVRTSNREESVAQLVKMMTGHATHHISAVARIREQHRC